MMCVCVCVCLGDDVCCGGCDQSIVISIRLLSVYEDLERKTLVLKPLIYKLYKELYICIYKYLCIIYIYIEYSGSYFD